MIYAKLLLGCAERRNKETDRQRADRWHAMRAADHPPGWDVEDTPAYMDSTGIQMQMLGNIPKTLEALRTSNDYAASLVCQYPTRFGMLAALPTDAPDATMDRNIELLFESCGHIPEQVRQIGRNALKLYPKVMKRIADGS